MSRRPAVAGLAAAALALAALWWLRSSPDANGGPPQVAEPAPTPPAPAERLVPRVLAAYPHDPGAFTQGLLWHDGALWESTGQYGRSEVRRVEVASGRVLRRAALPRELFGEGLARVGERLVQLTWREGRALVWDLAGLEVVAEHRYAGEGWGLCFDGRRLVMSDGTAELTFRDPESFAESGRVTALLEGRPVSNLNELECAGGEVWANVWSSEALVRIDPENGRVTAVVDASGLLAPAERAGVDVLNGVAWRPDTRSFYLTGKYWPKLFEVIFVPAGS